MLRVRLSFCTGLRPNASFAVPAPSARLQRRLALALSTSSLSSSSLSRGPWHSLPSPLAVSQQRHQTNSHKKELSTHVDTDYTPVDVGAKQMRGENIYTMTEYMEMQEQEMRGAKSLKDKASEATDNPMWLLWGLAAMGVCVASVVVGIRLRREQQRFNPELQTVKILDSDDGPQIGGPFELRNADGKVVRDSDLRGKWMYIYFGFVNCPDVCPDEMRKMTRVVRALDKKVGRDYWQPLFISIDPKRDTPEKVKEYLADFHPRILGLTGTSEQTDAAARNYRVYYAVPDEQGMTDADYLIDHSIIMYLMDPEGRFVDYTTKEFTWNESYTKLLRRMMDYEKEKMLAAKMAEAAAAAPKTSDVDGGPTDASKPKPKEYSTPINMRVATAGSVLAEDVEARAKHRAENPPSQVPPSMQRIR